MNEDFLCLLPCLMIKQFCSKLLYLNVSLVQRKEEKSTRKLQHSKGLSPLMPSCRVATSHTWLFRFKLQLKINSFKNTFPQLYQLPFSALKLQMASSYIWGQSRYQTQNILIKTSSKTVLFQTREGLANFFLKGQIVNMLGFKNNSTLSLRYENSQGQYINEWLYSIQISFIKTGGQPLVRILLTRVLDSSREKLNP